MRTGKTRYGAGDVLAVQAMRKGGVRISVEFAIVPFRDPLGAMMGVGAVLREPLPDSRRRNACDRASGRRAGAFSISTHAAPADQVRLKRAYEPPSPDRMASGC
jgi:hypothetical protein